MAKNSGIKVFGNRSKRSTKRESGFVKSESKLTFVCTDLIVSYFFSLFFIRLTSTVPFYELDAAITFLVLYGIALFLFVIRFDSTPGAALWGSAWIPGKKAVPLLSFDVPRRASAGVLLGLILLSGLFTNSWVNQHPYYKEAGTIDIERFAPDQIKPGEDGNWNALPFYYALGLWPRLVDGEPVIYTVPYRKGPPNQFADQVHVRLQSPGARLIIEGPKTPSGGYARELTRNCIQDKGRSSECAKLRRDVLSRHLREAKKRLSIFDWPDWELSWFEVNNSSLADAERPQGIYIRSESSDWIHERYVLINSRGRHQTLVLIRRNTDESNRFSSLMRNTVASLRVFNSLAENRVWINNELSETLVSKMNHTGNPFHDLRPLIDATSRLIAKITVEPKEFEAFFHLGGTAYLISDYVRSADKKKFPDNNIWKAFNLWSTEWNAVSRPLIRAAYFYSKDVKPSESRLPSLEKLWIDSQVKESR